MLRDPITAADTDIFLPDFGRILTSVGSFPNTLHGVFHNKKVYSVHFLDAVADDGC